MIEREKVRRSESTRGKAYETQKRKIEDRVRVGRIKWKDSRQTYRQTDDLTDSS